MPLVKISGGIFSTIKRWVFDKRKTITPDPFKPFKKKTIIELKLNGDNLRDVLHETHDPGTGLINKIIDLVNDLERRVTTNEAEIQGLKTVDQTKSAIGHSHVTSPTGGPSGPAMTRKGGKLQRGGNVNDVTTNLVAENNEFINRRTQKIVPTGTLYHLHPEKGPMEGATHNPDILGGTAGHDYFDKRNNSRTAPKSTSRDNFKQMLIQDILNLQK